MLMDEKFSVYQFFRNGTYEKVREQVGLLNAMQGAAHYCTSIAVGLGLVSRVIITDENDDCVFEWKDKEGIIFPTELSGRSDFLGRTEQGKTDALCAWLNE